MVVAEALLAPLLTCANECLERFRRLQGRGRGFDSRRLHFRKSLQINIFSRHKVCGNEHIAPVIEPAGSPAQDHKVS